MAAPRESEIHLAIRGINTHEPAGRWFALAARKNEDAASVADRRGDRRRITGSPFVAGSPHHPAGSQIKSRNTRAVWRADVHDELVTFNEWSGSDSEKILLDLEFPKNVPLPQELSCLQIHALQAAACPECEDAPVGDHGTRAWPRIKPVPIAVGRRIAELPVTPAIEGVHAI